MNKRLYKQNCSLAMASDLLGERWTFLILRELLIQPCRFKMLNQFLPNMGTNLLTARLKELEANKLITRQPPVGKQSPYVLTDKGKRSEALILEMIRWGLANTEGNSDYLHFHHWDFLALKALFVPDRIATGITVKFKTDELTAWVKVSSSQCEFAIEDTDEYDTQFDGSLKQLQNFMASGKKLSPELKVFVTCFDTPSFT